MAEGSDDLTELAVDAHIRYLASFARVWEEEDEGDDEGRQEKNGEDAAGASASPSALPPPPPPPLEHVASEHFWLSGLYWGLTALHLLGRLDGTLDTSKAWRWVQRCFRRVDQGGTDAGAPSHLLPSPSLPSLRSPLMGRSGGGYGGSPRHDVHLLSTTSAVQVAALLGKLDELDGEAIEEYVASLQLPDGSFAGDMWGEVDTRFSYCALLTLSLLWRGRVPDDGEEEEEEQQRQGRRRRRRSLVARCAAHVLRCRNFDGGFGAQPGGESHAGQVFTCVGVLALVRRLGWRHEDYKEDAAARGARDDDPSQPQRHNIMPGADLLAWWLCERQTPSGGLNGRPEKLQDVCYSWWCLSSLALLGRLAWIDRAALARFVLSCQDGLRGGISDRPDDAVDVYHTFFGVAGLGLLRWPGVVEEVDPAFALPKSVVERELFGFGGFGGGGGGGGVL